MTKKLVFYRQRIWRVTATDGNYILLKDIKRSWSTQWVHQRLVIYLTPKMEEGYVDS